MSDKDTKNPFEELQKQLQDFLKNPNVSVGVAPFFKPVTPEGGTSARRRCIMDPRNLPEFTGRPLKNCPSDFPPGGGSGIMALGHNPGFAKERHC